MAKSTKLGNFGPFKHMLDREHHKSMAEIKRLRFLGLNSNNLSGRVSPRLAALPCIGALYLYGNNFTGELEFSESFYRRMGRRFGAWNNPKLCYRAEVNSTGHVPYGVKSSSKSCLYLHEFEVGGKNGWEIPKSRMTNKCITNGHQITGSRSMTLSISTTPKTRAGGDQGRWGSGHCERGQKMINQSVEPASPPQSADQNEQKNDAAVAMATISSATLMSCIMSFVGALFF
ncbi:piriformospora indica-insensitive protein 2-like [Prunus yedoensis var. nudiflora]|uniref:Piriformospora indica-insensitive protein 2-like n=1 Tax=Prunus yedoensis var. nudiflora TaxID=2094558 RepID=A0A314XHN6_PRUYE|nr:piriformospora indica-insensitive protein 2-like [Prunus yedoensis var. nudiflora]